MVMSIMIYDEMTDKVGWNNEKTTTTTSNGDGKLPKAEEIELSFKLKANFAANYCKSAILHMTRYFLIIFISGNQINNVSSLNVTHWGVR